jgi:hypothetical protein
VKKEIEALKKKDAKLREKYAKNNPLAILGVSFTDEQKKAIERLKERGMAKKKIDEIIRQNCHNACCP